MHTLPLFALALLTQVGQRTPAPPPVDPPTRALETPRPAVRPPIQGTPVLGQGGSLVLYDVRDLVDPSRRPGMEEASDAAAADAFRRNAENLAEVAGTFLEPPLEGPAQELRALQSGSIAAVLAPEQHLWLQAFLDQQRRDPDELVQTEIRFVKVAPEAVHRVGLLPADVPAPSTEPVDPLTAPRWEEGDPLHTSRAPEPRFLEGPELAELLRALEAEPTAEIVGAPRILTFSRAPAELSVLNQVTYVADYEVHEHVEPGDRTVIDPVIAVATDGIFTRATVVRLAPGQLGVIYRVEYRELKRPIQAFQTVYGEIGLPETSVSTVSSAMALADGICAVLPPFPVDGMLMSVLIRVEGIESSALDPPAGESR
jgi:hypothetical protein